MAPKRKSKRELELNTDTDAGGDTDTKQSPRKRRRLLRGCLTVVGGLLLILAVALFFAPTIVARTALRQRIVPLALPDFQGQVSIDSASLGWFSAIELRGVKISDLDGGELADARRITSEKTLWGLLWNPNQLGKFQIDQPHVQVTMTEASSNLEAAIAPYLTSSGSAAPLPQFAIVVKEGVVDARDSVTDTSWSLQKVEATVEATGKGSELMVKVSANAASPSAGPASIAADLHYCPAKEGDAPRADNRLRLNSESLDLAILPPLLRRFAGPLTTGGAATCTATYQWNDDGSSQSVQIDNLHVAQLDVGAPQWLGGERLQLPIVNASGHVSMQGDKLVAENLLVTSDLAKLDADGTFDLGKLSPDLLTSLLQETDAKASGEVDLALLAKSFPQTLRIRDGISVTSGKVTATVYSRLENQRRRWGAVVETANLTAVSAGQPIRWDQPIHVTMFAGQTPNGPAIEQFICKSNFLQLDGQGSLATGQLAIKGDLDKLAVELAKFVDLSGYQLAGTVAGKLNWDRATSEQLSLTGNATVEQFALVVPGALPWREQQLTLALRAAGRTQEQQISQLDSASLRVESAGDVLDVHLTEPVANVSRATKLPLRCKLVGDLATWLPRVQTWLPAAGWNVAGQIDADATGTVSSQSFEVASSNVAINQFLASGNGLRISEPEVRATASIEGDLTSGVITSKEATLISSSIALRTGNVKIEPRGAGVALSGQVAYRGDLDRLTSWLHDPDAPASHHLWGEATGQASLAYDGAVTLADWSTEVKNFVAASRRTNPAPGAGTNVIAASNASPWEEVWREKQLNLKGKGDYSHVSGDVNLDAFDLRCDALKISTKGKISDLSNQCLADVKGEFTYDLKTVAGLLRPYVGSDFEMEGSDTRQYALQGPLFDPALQATVAAATSHPAPANSKRISDRLTAQTSLGWSMIQAQGFRFSQGEVEANLAKGVVAFDPLDLAVNSGRVKLTPRILLNAEQPTLIVERGQVIDKVQLTPEMCHAWLKYVAPLLADATVAKGEISMDVEDVKLPLASPTSGTLRGALQIHGAQVGAGPLGQQIENIARQVIALTKGRGVDPSRLGQSREWLTLPEQTIKYHLADGKVHHEGLELVSREVTVRTKGYVGLDQSLALTASIPIRDEWVASSELLATLKGQTLEVPIRGTLSKPAVDNQVLANLGKSMLGGVIEQKLGEELKKGLQGLFKPKP